MEEEEEEKMDVVWSLDGEKKTLGLQDDLWEEEDWPMERQDLKIWGPKKTLVPVCQARSAENPRSPTLANEGKKEQGESRGRRRERV